MARRRGHQVSAPAGNPAPQAYQVAPHHGGDQFTDAHLTRGRLVSILSALFALLIVCAIAAASFGSAHISLSRAFTDPMSPDHAIFFGARLPRVLMGAVVGAVLAAVGAALQALVRNPLAEGGILGLSGGVAL